MSYEKDVRPLLMKLANTPPDGRQKTFEILQEFDVRNGEDIPADCLADAKAMAENALDDLGNTGGEEDEFDV